MGVVFACVHHADVIAHRTGEPYGTLVLTIAVTVIEVALILSIMLAGEGRPTLARETVFAVIMIVCNGVVGLCLVLGGLRYGEQGFRLPGTSAYLVVLMPLATLTLILPTYTSSVPGPYYTPSAARLRGAGHPRALWRVPLRADGAPSRLLPVRSWRRRRRARRKTGGTAGLGERRCC